MELRVDVQSEPSNGAELILNIMPQQDDFTLYHKKLLDSHYDFVARIVLNGYFPPWTTRRRFSNKAPQAARL
jgi:hypothetical protein